MKRRRFVAAIAEFAATGVFTAGLLGVLARFVRRGPDPHRTVSDPPVLRPPGALDEADFLATCVRCNRCRDACPSGAIQLAGPNDPADWGTPFVLPAEAACILCLECTLTCPTGALRPLREKPEVEMGKAVVDIRTCVSHNRTGVCGACHTACPFRNKAITQDLRNAPIVHEEHCVGCGLCEEACIVQGTKAIRVFSEREV